MVAEAGRARDAHAGRGGCWRNSLERPCWAGLGWLAHPVCRRGWCAELILNLRDRLHRGVAPRVEDTRASELVLPLLFGIKGAAVCVALAVEEVLSVGAERAEGHLMVDAACVAVCRAHARARCTKALVGANIEGHALPRRWLVLVRITCDAHI